LNFPVAAQEDFLELTRQLGSDGEARAIVPECLRIFQDEGIFASDSDSVQDQWNSRRAGLRRKGPYGRRLPCPNPMRSHCVHWAGRCLSASGPQTHSIYVFPPTRWPRTFLLSMRSEHQTALLPRVPLSTPDRSYLDLYPSVVVLPTFLLQRSGRRLAAIVLAIKRP
jgi:hypothetical protein